MTLEWPWRRREVLDALETLAGPPRLGWGVDGTLLESAIHQLLDDTGWDQPDVDIADSVGTILVNAEEVALLRSLVEALAGVSKRQGPTSGDEAWFDDGSWPQVQRLAATALAQLINNEPLPPLGDADSILSSVEVTDPPAVGARRASRGDVLGLDEERYPDPDDRTAFHIDEWNGTGWTSCGTAVGRIELVSFLQSSTRSEPGR